MNCSQNKSILKHNLNPFQIFNFDLIVIGSSECGLICAKDAVAHGYRVCVLSESYACEKIRENEYLRFLHESFKFKSIFKKAKDYGWKNFEYQNTDPFSWELLKHKVCNTANSAAKKYLTLLIDKRVHYIRSDSVKFLNEHLIIDSDTSQIFYGENIVITPTVINNSCNIQFPDIIGAEEFGILLNNLTKDLENINGDILIIGSGRNALMLAAILSYISDNGITLMCRNCILQNYDQEMINIFIESNQFKYLPKCLIHCIRSVTSNEGNTCCNLHKYEINFTQLSEKWRQQKYYDRIIFTSQYKIDYNKYDFKSANLKTIDNSLENCKFQTNLSHIYLIDDLSEIMENYGYNRIQIGRNLSKYIFMKKYENSSTKHRGTGNDIKILNDLDKTDLILGFHLDYSFVGMTEIEAKLKYECNNIECYTNKFCMFYNTPSYYSSYPKNYLKIITLKNNDKNILGIHLLAKNAGDIIQGYAAALRCGITLDCIINCIGIYPTLSWEFTRIDCSENRYKTDDCGYPADEK